MKLEEEYEFEEQPSVLGRVLVGMAAVILFILLILLVVFWLGSGKKEPIDEDLQVQATETPKPIATPAPTSTPRPKPETSIENENPTGMGQDPEEIIPKDEEPNVEEGHVFWEVEETITAKDATNLRNMPSQGTESKVMITLKNGQKATRIGISDTGWSKVEYKGKVYYAVSNYLTTDLTPPTPVPIDDGIKTVFTDCDEMVSPKIEVNLRKLPSVTNPEAEIVVKLLNGARLKRTGINTDVGWSRVEYEGQTLYCVSSYVYVVE